MKTELDLDQLPEEVEPKEPEITFNTPMEEKVTIETIKASNDLKSKKFIAYFFSIAVAIGGFVFTYIVSKDSANFYKFLDFLLYTFIAYVGGNSVERLAEKMGKR